MSPGDVTSNLYTAMHALGSAGSDIERIQRCIQDGRARLARRLYQELGLADPANEPS
jgi:hypothetical protein